MQCPVLNAGCYVVSDIGIPPIVLRLRYAMSGTETSRTTVVLGAGTVQDNGGQLLDARCRAVCSYALFKSFRVIISHHPTPTCYATCYQPTHPLCDVRYSPNVCCSRYTQMLSGVLFETVEQVASYGVAMRSPVLTSRMMLRGALPSPYALSMRCPVLKWRMVLLGSVPITLRACYAMPGTEMAYGATRWSLRLKSGAPTVPAYALPGTDMPYVPMRYPVLRNRMCLCAARY
eukprot:2258993-Rhodomonas_salina.4